MLVKFMINASVERATKIICFWKRLIVHAAFSHLVFLIMGVSRRLATRVTA